MKTFLSSMHTMHIVIVISGSISNHSEMIQMRDVIKKTSFQYVGIFIRGISFAIHKEAATHQTKLKHIHLMIASFDNVLVFFLFNYSLLLHRQMPLNGLT